MNFEELKKHRFHNDFMTLGAYNAIDLVFTGKKEAIEKLKQFVRQSLVLDEDLQSFGITFDTISDIEIDNEHSGYHITGHAEGRFNYEFVAKKFQKNLDIFGELNFEFAELITEAGVYINTDNTRKLIPNNIFLEGSFTDAYGNEKILELENYPDVDSLRVALKEWANLDISNGMTESDMVDFLEENGMSDIMINYGVCKNPFEK